MESLIQWTWTWANWDTVKDRKAWHAAVHEVAKNQTQHSDWTTTNVLSGFCLLTWSPSSSPSELNFPFPWSLSYDAVHTRLPLCPEFWRVLNRLIGLLYLWFCSSVQDSAPPHTLLCSHNLCYKLTLYFSLGVCMCMCVYVLSHVQLSVAPWPLTRWLLCPQNFLYW